MAQSTITSYGQAAEYLSGGRNKDSRPLHGRSTTLVRLNDHAIAVRYHWTPIVIYYDDGDIKLEANGFNTLTTRAKMTEYLPSGWNVWSDKGTMRLYRAGDAGKREVFNFKDGITIHEDGTVTDFAPTTDVEAGTKLRKDIRTYAKKFAAALMAGKVDADRGGDCFYCQFQSVADHGESWDHIQTHMEEDYFVGSLLLKATQAPDAPVSQVYLYAMNDYFNKGEGADSFKMLGGSPYFETMTVKILVKYLTNAARNMDGNKPVRAWQS